MKPAVLIVGGTGVFGSRLAQRLIAVDQVRVIVAGRDAIRLAAFCARYGGEFRALDRSGALDELLGEIAPAVVVDAAGPFQDYGDDPYRRVHAAIGARCHYLDFSDDAAFTAGVESLDAAARAAGVVVLSGVSSVPALSAAVVRALSADLETIDCIDSVIQPGNRAPRGLSVVRAIVAQVGKPLRLWRGRCWTRAPAWNGLTRVCLEIKGVAPLGARWASVIGAPDLQLFPKRFAAQSVLFRAGLELSLMHLGLWLMSWPIRLGLLKSLSPMTRPLYALAKRLERFGSDRGGMQVSVTGIARGSGRRTRRRWTLIAEAGSGPEIPALPAFVLITALLRGGVPSGARACLDELSLDDFESSLPRPAMQTGRSEAPAPVLYEQLLGPGHAYLPPALQALHAVVDRLQFRGTAVVETGSHVLARAIRRVMRFPAAATAIPVEVTMVCEDGGERWTRRFGRSVFHSVLRRTAQERPGECRERFGLFDFGIRLIADERGLSMPVRDARFLGIPLPHALTPVSRTREFVDDAGDAAFDVEVLLPGIGRIIRYRGSLRPVIDPD